MIILSILFAAFVLLTLSRIENKLDSILKDIKDNQ